MPLAGRPALYDDADLEAIGLQEELGGQIEAIADLVAEQIDPPAGLLELGHSTSIIDRHGSDRGKRLGDPPYPVTQPEHR